MGRKNHNAQPIHRPKESWISLLPYQGRIELRKSIKAYGTCGRAPLRITGESIVREHRKQYAEGSRQYAIENKDKEKPMPTFQPYRVIPQAHPSFIRRFFDRINWGRVFDLTCAILAAIAIAYLFAFIVFGPFMGKEFWK